MATTYHEIMSSPAEMTIETRPLLSICICTYRRSQLLEELLHAIYDRLELPGPTEIIVVDNDAAGSASSVLRKFAHRELPLRSYRVPNQNLSMARNKSIKEARGRWIAMIDDDEIPRSHWIARLLRCASETEADAVFGPVLPRFPSTAPRWIVEGKFFERARHATGTVLSPSDTRTGNVLISSTAIGDLEEPFKLAFGLTGGEDSHLFSRLLREGKRLVWCDEAEVEETIGENRLNAQWLIKRWFRGGQTFALITLDPENVDGTMLVTKAVFIIRSLLLSVAASTMFLATLPMGRKVCFKWVKVLAIQAGKLCPPSLFTYQEYREPESN